MAKEDFTQLHTAFLDNATATVLLLPFSTDNSKCVPEFTKHQLLTKVEEIRESPALVYIVGIKVIRTKVDYWIHYDSNVKAMIKAKGPILLCNIFEGFPRESWRWLAKC